MTEINLWPTLTFLFCAFNLAAWYFHGAPLFSWWWIFAVIAIQTLLLMLTIAIAAAMPRR